MKKRAAEYLKLMSALGAMAGLKTGWKKDTASGDFAVQVPGLRQKTWIRKETSDWMAFKQVFVWKEYEYPILFNPFRILDAGGNVGYAALWFARKYPNAEIVSLEPESSNFEMLQKNTQAYKNIVSVNAGLWGRSCFLRIIPNERGNWAFRTEETEIETENSIRALSIKEILEKYKWDEIDILKMDIEGAEANVFKEASNEWLPKVRLIFLELHDNIQKDCSKNVFKALIEHDFRVDIMGENIVLINNLHK